MSRQLLVAHGSPDPRHAAFVRSLATGVSAHGVRTEAAFLEHDLPDVASWLAGAEGPVTALSLLLAPGYHAQEDVPRLLATAPDGVDVSDLGVLGSGPWLYDVVDELVASAGGDRATPVVLVAAGSSRQAAAEHLQAFVAGWAAHPAGPGAAGLPGAARRAGRPLAGRGRRTAPRRAGRDRRPDRRRGRRPRRPGRRPSWGSPRGSSASWPSGSPVASPPSPERRICGRT